MALQRLSNGQEGEHVEGQMEDPNMIERGCEQPADSKNP